MFHARHARLAKQEGHPSLAVLALGEKFLRFSHAT